MQIEEFKLEKKWWKKRKESEYAWKVSAKDIKARNYNLDVKNPHEGEQVVYDPEELLKKYTKQQEEISNLRNKLKAILGDALSNGGKAL